METSTDPRCLARAEAFLLELKEDGRTAPPEFQPVVEPYIPRAEACISAYRDHRLGGRELDASIFQIRLAYARDLDRVLPVEPKPTSRWVRSDDSAPTA